MQPRGVWQWCAARVAWAKKNASNVYQGNTDEDDLSNMTPNTKSVVLVQLSNAMWSGVGCPAIGPKGGDVQHDVAEAVQLALPLVQQVLGEREWGALQRHLATNGFRCHMMFVNVCCPASKVQEAGAVIPHINTLASFGTVVILLSDTTRGDQMSLYNAPAEEAVAFRSANVVTTKSLCSAGQAVAFRAGTPHVVLGGARRKKPRYTLNIFF